MAKKDFSKANTGRVYGTIADATAEEKNTRKPRKTYTEEEAAEIMQTLHTVGRKGIKLPRINLAFTSENYDYINIMSRVRGENLTEFVNAIIQKHRETHMDIYNKAIEFKNSL